MTTKKDYEAVAKVIRETIEGYPESQHAQRAIEDVAKGLAEHFIQDNPRFDRHRFLDACIPIKKVELFK